MKVGGKGCCLVHVGACNNGGWLLANKEDIVDPSRLPWRQRQIYDKAKAFIDGNQATDVAGADLADEIRYSWSGVVFQRKRHVIRGLKQAELDILITDALEAKRTEARTSLKK